MPVPALISPNYTLLPQMARLFKCPGCLKQFDNDRGFGNHKRACKQLKSQGVNQLHQRQLRLERKAKLLADEERENQDDIEMQQDILQIDPEPAEVRNLSFNCRETSNLPFFR